MIAEYGMSEKLAEKPAETLNQNQQNGHRLNGKKALPLPVGYTDRPVTMDDLEAAVELFNICSMALQGVKTHKVEDLRREWEYPGFDQVNDSRAVFTAEGQLAGYYDVFDRGEPHVTIFVWGKIHPAHTDSGIGEYLLAWAEERARQMVVRAPAEARVAMLGFSLAMDTATQSLLERAGLKLIRYSFRMVIELDEEPAEPVWPDGITVRTANWDEDLPAVVAVVREAFADHWGHVDTPFEEELERWRHWNGSDPDFDPTLWWLAMDGEEIAGVNLGKAKMTDDPAMGWVGTLGVRRPWRRHGLGLALLQQAFGEFYRRGQKRVGLGVDAQNLTGALRLYEGAGMRSDPNWQHCTYEKELRPGVDLMRQQLEK
jgi:mycothiol synthase